MGLSGVASIFMFTSTPLNLLSESMFSAMNSFLLVAVPLFLLVGQLMERGESPTGFSTLPMRPSAGCLAAWAMST
ncbi:TRAP transporter large permease subunit [Polaromonas sp. P1(28)-8]|nr:TRAP transporter large permease subunit [Polaromonas sp. P1(28)-8]